VLAYEHLATGQFAHVDLLARDHWTPWISKLSSQFNCMQFRSK